MLQVGINYGVHYLLRSVTSMYKDYKLFYDFVSNYYLNILYINIKIWYTSQIVVTMHYCIDTHTQGRI